MLWIVRHLCPSRVRFIFNCYRHWSSLGLWKVNGTAIFLHSREVVTQGDPLAMVAYGIGILLMIKIMKAEFPDVIQTWYADNAGCNRSVFPCTYTEEWYVSTYSQSVYLRYQTTITPSLANPPIIETSPGTPLHGPVAWNTARTWPYSTLQLRLRLRLFLQSRASLTPSQSSRVLHHCVKNPHTIESGIRR